MDAGLDGLPGPWGTRLGMGERQRPRGDRRDCLPGSPWGHPPKQSTPEGPAHGTAPAKPSMSRKVRKVLGKVRTHPMDAEAQGAHPQERTGNSLKHTQDHTHLE